MKKFLTIVMACVMSVCVLTACGTSVNTEDLTGAHVFMFKNTGNASTLV